MAGYFPALQAHFSSRLELERWWPGRTRFAICAGAILVQHTAWTNVEPALRALRRAHALSVAGVCRLDRRRLEALIRPAGCWRAKARCLRAFAAWVQHDFHGSLGRLFAQPTARARTQLLAVPGIGPETADAILLYAGGHPSPVVDNYTRRIFTRHGLGPEADGYDDWQRWLAQQATIDAKIEERSAHVRLHRHWHALLVETAKRYCKRQRPDCTACPLGPFLPQTQG